MYRKTRAPYIDHDAIALVVAHLPDNCGPPVDATAHDLRNPTSPGRRLSP